MNAKELMTSEPLYCIPETSLQAVAMVMGDNHLGAIPVVHGKTNLRLVWIITDRDITCRAVAKGVNPREAMVGDFMSDAIAAATPDTPVEECCRLMEELQIRRVPIVDEDGRLCGIVTQSQIVRKVPEDLAAEVVRRVSEPSETASLVGSRS